MLSILYCSKCVYEGRRGHTIVPEGTNRATKEAIETDENVTNLSNIIKDHHWMKAAGPSLRAVSFTTSVVYGCCIACAKALFRTLCNHLYMPSILTVDMCSWTTAVLTVGQTTKW